MFTRKNIIAATTQLLASVVAAAVLFAATSDAQAALVGPVISVNFTNTNTGGGPAIGGPAGVEQVSNWNNTAGPAGGPLALLDDSGAGTGATVSWSVGNTWGAANAQTGTTPDGDMMTGYLDNFGGNNFTVSGLSSAFTTYGYSVYVYHATDSAGVMGFTADDGTITDTRYGRQAGGGGSNYPLGGPNGYIVSTDTVNGAATTASNAVLIEGLFGTNLTVTGVNGAFGDGRSPPNGFQIVANVPEPTSFVVWSIFGAGLAACRWRRRNR